MGCPCRRSASGGWRSTASAPTSRSRRSAPGRRRSRAQSAMKAEDKENFASRWSRRKIEARKTEEKPAEPKPSSEAAVSAAPADAAAAPPGAPAPRELPPLESLKGLASEYTEFLKPGVDENLRRSAL